MSQVRLGFVGAGKMGQCAHLRSYATVPDCRVVALAELRPHLREKVAARYDIERTYPDHRAMLEAENLDGIVAAQPFAHHGVIVPELLQAGVPVFIEKPLARAVEVGEMICEKADAENTPLLVGYHKRSDPAVMWAKEQIDRLSESGDCGAMTYICLTMPPGDWIAGGFDDLLETDEPLPDMPTDPPPEGMDDETLQEYEEFVNYYIHQVNLLRHLLGEDYEVEHADTSGILLIARSRSGIPGIIEMEPYSTSIDWHERALVCFERGYLTLALAPPLARNRAGRVELFEDPGDGTPRTVHPSLPPIDAMRQQAENFVSAIRGQQTPMCDAREALQDLRIAEEYIQTRQRN